MLVAMPRTPEPKEERKSTQIRVELALWERANAQAKRRRQSLNAYILSALERQVAEDERTQATA
jgi:predicted HicB family RNase H-like nuclease